MNTRRTIKLAAFAALIFQSLVCDAGYLATGPIKAEDCYNFGIKICSIKTVTEVRKDGKRYEVARYYESVSSYNSANSTCYITTKSQDGGLISFAINAIKQPDFWGMSSDGKFGKIDANYIYFSCIRQ